ncbi:unnamed protein product, partial [Phaeothamnion confervicola]
AAAASAERRWRMSAKEEDKQTGHQARSGTPRMTPEEQALAKAINEHQQAAPRMSKAEEVRTLMEYSTGFGVISTLSNKLGGYPNGAVVGFALDRRGRPVFSFSTMSSHTGDIAADGRASLTVMSKTFKGAQDGRVTLIGDVNRVTDAAELEAVKAIYRARHPNAFWIDFGDFSFFRMDTVKAIRFVGGFAMAGDITGDDYMSAQPDPITAFAEPIMNHMNSDHGDSTTAMVEHYITKGLAKVDSAEIVGVDRLGMSVVVGLNGEKGKLRLPFPRAAADRKDVKTLIVEMTEASAGGGGGGA